MKRAEFKAGDILGFSGDSWVSAGINLATYGIPFWGLSHVGIVGRCISGPGTELLLFESTTFADTPCAILGKTFEGSQAHAIEARVDSYNGKVWHYPLYRKLMGVEQRKLFNFLLANLGREYDAIGAFRSGGIGWSWIESKLRKEDLESLFCSEYCAAAHKHIGALATDHAGRWSPNRLVRTERRKGILLKPRRLK